MDEQIKTRMVEANGLTFEVDECGTGSKFALLLHGFPESKYSWRHQIPLLVKLGYRVWAPNLRGYGKTTRPTEVAAYHIDRLVEDVAGLVEAAGAKETLLVAHDWGAIISWHVAMRKAIALERLVIMNLPHPACFVRELKTWDQMKRSWYMFAFQLPFVPEKILTANNAETVARSFTDMAVDKSRFPKEVIDEYRRAALEPGAARAMVNYYRALRKTKMSVSVPKPGTVDAKTLMIWGASDTALSFATTEGTDKYVADLTFRKLPNVSHWVQQEAPEKVNVILEAWLTGKEVPRFDL